MITRAYIHEYGNGKMEPEHADVLEVLESRGIACELFTQKRLQRSQLALNKSTLVVGDHQIMQSILKKWGYHKELLTYPVVLRPYLKRNIHETTLSNLITESNHTDLSHIFIKPKGKSKLFTGFVVNSNEDLFALFNLSKNTRLFVSSVVEWSSEFRVFVNNSTIVGIQHYDGNPEYAIDLSVVKKAINDLKNSTENTRGYALDFGVLSNGETALVEWNDGYALGSYGLDKEVYTELILSRWNEIMLEI
jgi:hypothetical protein